MVKLISLEGSIGAGKSTLLHHLLCNKRMKNVILIPEPVKIWEDIIDSKGKNILEAFYDDKNNVAFAFQMIALFSRFKLLKQKYNEAKELEAKIGKTVYLITERTILSDYHVFAKSLYEDGYINEHEIMSYKIWNDYFSKEFHIDKVIYVRTDINICLKRIAIRNRDGEKDGITKDYLQNIENAHINFIKSLNSQTMTIFNDLDVNSEYYCQLIEQIADFITHDDKKSRRLYIQFKCILFILMLTIALFVYICYFKF